VIRRGRDMAKKKTLSDRSADTGDIRGFSNSYSKVVAGRDQGIVGMKFPGRAVCGPPP
jgi:hypothetical protein